MGSNSQRKRFVLIAHIPFKINLGLYVTRRREDGFHDLETVFYPVHNLEDTIEMRASEGDVSFEQEGGDFIVDMEKNLCVKAFRILQRAYNLPGAHIKLHKRIPSGAGLGGGSADAAGVLKLTNEIYNLHISNKLLEEFAGKLGSDVPFFVQEIPSYATGRGEILSPIDIDLSQKVISVFKPDFSISTAEAYACVKPNDSRTHLDKIIQQNAKNWQNTLPNDFETSLFPKYPILAEIKQKYYELGAEYASLSGSGSAIFAIAKKKIDLLPYFKGMTL